MTVIQSPSAYGWLLAKLERLGIDFHVLYTLFSRAWLIAAGGVTILIVPHFLSAVEQGFYYTFAGLLGLSVFFELGLNQVLIQTVGREIPFIEKSGNGYAGKSDSLDRLSSLAILISRWYRAAAALFWVGLSFGGYFFFRARNQLPEQQWLTPWLLLSFAGAANLYFSPQLAVMEGLGRVGNIARFRLFQSVVGYSLMWGALALGAGLYSVVTVQLTASILYIGLMRKWFPEVHWLRNRTIECDEDRLVWRRDILPFQWRIALSWISGYFIYQFITPIVFVRLGASDAGKLGMALNIFSAITTVGVSWVVANSSKFAGYVSQGDRIRLDSEHRSLLKKAVTFTLLAAIGVLLGLKALDLLELQLMKRLPDFVALTALAAACIGNTAIIGLALYMHAHGKDPLVFPSLACGVLTVLSVYVASQYNIIAVCYAYLFVVVVVFVPWTSMVFRRFRKTWSFS